MRRRGLTVGPLTQDTSFERPDRIVRDTYEQVLSAPRAEKVPRLNASDQRGRIQPACSRTHIRGREPVGRVTVLALAISHLSRW
jgi:hypothetical protein